MKGDKIDKVTETTKFDDELVRALSSTTSIAQMRDLLTEPTFPGLLPVERTTKLGCLPPPDSAAFEATLKLKANIEIKDGATKAGIDGQYADSVVKLFEESERTIFLQYALFRLCEMSINAPAGFRNVYPVVVHDIVRRSAEISQLATKQTEMRRSKEEETKQKNIDLKIEENKRAMALDAANFDSQKNVAELKAVQDKDKNAALLKIYTDCVSKELAKTTSDKPTEINANCKILANF